MTCNVIYHNQQGEISHFQSERERGIRWGMEESENFRRNLKRLREEKGIDAKSLSISAGLGERGVKDIEEGRSQSPKISTVFKLARALDADPITMMGVTSRPAINAKLAEFLDQYDEDGQEQLLGALSVLPLSIPTKQ
tara:strand:+ start:1016 stop:1429 length:414 start_codon:yes stop_codon:yes gene_type:complete